MKLDYDKLVRDYVESLQAKLRNFAVEPEFLGMWVHDEDDHKSLYEMFLAAKGAGREGLTVSVGAATWRRIDEARLSRELGRLGGMKLGKNKDAVEIAVDFREKGAVLGAPQKEVREVSKRGPDAASHRNNEASSAAGPSAPAREGLHPAYRAAIEKAGRDIRFEGPPPSAAPGRGPGLRPSALRGVGSGVDPAGRVTARAEDGGASLSASVDAEGLVREARHSGASGPLRAMLDILCASILPNRPIQEAQDHAAIRLEALLRDRTVPPPVRGVLTPGNADPIFDRPQKMLRELFKDYLGKTGRSAGPNFWDDGPCAAWRALSPQERLSRARAAVAEGCRELGLGDSGVEVVEMIGEARVVLGHVPAAAHANFAPAMMRLERLLKHALDPRIELHLESLDDKNRRAQRTQRG